MAAGSAFSSRSSVRAPLSMRPARACAAALLLVSLLVGDAPHALLGAGRTRTTPVLLVQAGDSGPEGRQTMKVIQGAPRGSSAHSVSARPNPPIPSRGRDPVTGPELVTRLEHQCFSYQDTVYEYKVCPFHNVTQRELAESWNSFHGLLGVWGEWIVEDDRYAGMQYTDGTACNPDLLRSVRINLECGTDGLATVEEPETCVYLATLRVPEVCEADMQVPGALSEYLQARDGVASGSGDGAADNGGEASDASGDADISTTASPIGDAFPAAAEAAVSASGSAEGVDAAGADSAGSDDASVPVGTAGADAAAVRGLHDGRDTAPSEALPAASVTPGADSAKSAGHEGAKGGVAADDVTALTSDIAALRATVLQHTTQAQEHAGVLQSQLVSALDRLSQRVAALAQAGTACGSGAGG